MCIEDPERVHASVSRLVRRWVTKLERLEHVRRQSTLLMDLGQMEDQDLRQMAPEELLSLGAPRAARRDPTATKSSRCCASAAAAAPCPFLELGHDEVGVVALTLTLPLPLPLPLSLTLTLGTRAAGALHSCWPYLLWRILTLAILTMWQAPHLRRARRGRQEQSQRHTATRGGGRAGAQ